MSRKRRGREASRDGGGAATGGRAVRRAGGHSENEQSIGMEEYWMSGKDDGGGPRLVKTSRMVAYERFETWRLAHRLALKVFSATDSWPRSELFMLTSQTRRAALSVPTNLAEGAAKRGRREFARFLDISLGSLAELSYLLRFSRDRRLLSEPQWRALESTRDQTGKLVYGLYRRMRAPAPDAPGRATH